MRRRRLNSFKQMINQICATKVQMRAGICLIKWYSDIKIAPANYRRKIVDTCHLIWYNNGRKGWRFWLGFFPSVRAKGTKSRRPCARWMAAYFYFLEPKLRPSSIATNTKEIIMQNREIISKSDMTFTSYAFVEHQRWRSQAPSYSFLPIESMK